MEADGVFGHHRLGENHARVVDVVDKAQCLHRRTGTGHRCWSSVKYFSATNTSFSGFSLFPSTFVTVSASSVVDAGFTCASV